MTVGERIKKVRKEMDLTQQVFCSKIGLKRNSISLVESGKRNISDQAIKSICREFNVDEIWLRTGEGEMFRKQSREDELAAYMNSLLQSEPDDIRRRFTTAISRLSTKQLEILESIMIQTVKDLQSVEQQPEKTTSATQQSQPTKFVGAPTAESDEAAPDPEIEAQVERYRQHLIAKTKAKSMARSPAKEMTLEEMQAEIARQYALEQDTADELSGFILGNSGMATG